MALDINYFRVVNRPAEIVNSTTGHTPITSPSVADKNVSDLSLDGTNVYKFNHLKESQKATLTGVNEGENDLFTKNERKEDNILTSYHENRIITSPNTESSPLRPLLYHKIEEKPVNETNPNIINDDNLNYQPISFKPPALINNSNLFSKQQPSALDTVELDPIKREGTNPIVPGRVKLNKLKIVQLNKSASCRKDDIEKF